MVSCEFPLRYCEWGIFVGWLPVVLHATAAGMDSVPGEVSSIMEAAERFISMRGSIGASGSSLYIGMIWRGVFT